MEVCVCDCKSFEKLKQCVQYFFYVQLGSYYVKIGIVVSSFAFHAMRPVFESRISYECLLLFGILMTVHWMFGELPAKKNKASAVTLHNKNIMWSVHFQLFFLITISNTEYPLTHLLLILGTSTFIYTLSHCRKLRITFQQTISNSDIKQL